MPDKPADNSAPTSRDAAIADPAEVQRTIDYLLKLDSTDRAKFDQAVADHIVELTDRRYEADPAMTEALHSEEVAKRAFEATRTLLKQAAEMDRRRGRTAQQRRGTERFRQAVVREQRIIKAILDGMDARKGKLSDARSPRQRAMRRLVTENLKGDVPKGRFIELHNEEKEKDAEAAEAAKKARREARAAKRRSRQS